MLNQHRLLSSSDDNGLADAIKLRGAPDALNQEFLSAGDQEARRSVAIGAPQGLFDFGEGYVVRLQFRRRHQHLVLLLSAANRRHLRDAGHRKKAAANHRVGNGA